uniref:Transmembrane protein n=1 Tax=Manihot esculenta TaxID=3983 RepID=A0A2C9ULX7_MANES
MHTYEAMMMRSFPGVSDRANGEGHRSMAGLLGWPAKIFFSLATGCCSHGGAVIPFSCPDHIILIRSEPPYFFQFYLSRSVAFLLLLVCQCFFFF